MVLNVADYLIAAVAVYPVQRVSGSAGNRLLSVE